LCSAKQGTSLCSCLARRCHQAPALGAALRLAALRLAVLLRPVLAAAARVQRARAATLPSPNFVDIVLRIARAARPLHALAPPQTWCEEQTSVWINALAAFSLRVAPALEVGGELLISVVHDFLALPAAALLPFLERSAEHSPQLKAFLAELAKDGNPLAAPEDSSAAAGRARAATKRLRWGRKGAALRTLLSAGVANEHPCAERIMRDMHPAPSRPVTAPQDLGPGLEATAEGVQRALDELFKCDFTSMDFSGWSMDLLRPVRGRVDIMQPLHALVLAIANCEAPLSVFWMITPGALVALHKLEEEAQAARAASGLDPKLRPVNKSALLWKAATQVAIMHPEYDRAAKAMQPLQLGLGAKFGMSRMALSAQDYYAQGYSIGEVDADNGFNSASRQAMLEAMLRECPHMARLFWMGYCSHAPLVLMRRGNDFVVLHSAEGSRMGDKFGSFAFDLAVHPAYLEIQAACPSVVFQAATDDLKSYARDPLDLCRMFPIASAALEKHAGVRFNPAKSAILLAAGHADLDPADVPEGVQIKRDGTVVVGAAVGTDQFVQDHLMAVVRQATRKFEALDLLDPQSALLLLSLAALLSRWGTTCR
jgi:hypothetical protein